MKKLGIYIHIPFCKQACHYCNFHFSTSMKYYERMLQAIFSEIEQRKEEFANKEIQSIYFGGGTPSLLSSDEVSEFISRISNLAHFKKDVEITIEANPDDLDLAKIISFEKSKMNRFSIGVQSFFESHLKWMNRSHNAKQAEDVMTYLKENGDSVISADLIFGLPSLTNDEWKFNLDKMYSFDIAHWSCYNLTVEPNTVLHHRVKNNIEPNVDDRKGAVQFEYLMDFAKSVGMDHYEISNYCKPGKHAVHNTNYWKEVPYIGIGPSAHSYDGAKRSWNIAHNMQYINGIEKGLASQGGDQIRTFEDRSKETIYNEYVMTSLRTKWGCSLNRIAQIDPSFEQFFMEEINPFIHDKWVEQNGKIFSLTRAGKLRADIIASDLFIV